MTGVRAAGADPRDDGRVTPPPSPTSRPLGGRRLLALGAVFVAIPVLTVGALLAALSEDTGPRVAGLLLLVAALVTAGAGGAVALRRGGDPRRLLLAAAGALLLAALVAFAVVATRPTVFVADLVIIGGVPAMGAVVLALVARLTPDVEE